jgi:hypothetical protein
MMATTHLDVTTMVVIAAEIRPPRALAHCANAGTVQRWNRKIVPAKKEAVSYQTTRKTVTATMKTTIVNVIGMEETVVPSRTVAQSLPNIARHAHVWTPRIKVTVTAKAFANSRTTKGMAIVTTKTTTVAASMTAEIVVRKPTRTALLGLNTAKLASALTPKLAVATAAEKTVQGSVNSRTTKGMATVTTKITTVAAGTTAATAVLLPSKTEYFLTNTAKNASAKTQRAAQGLVNSRTTKGMATVTTKTTIAAVDMMAVIAARKLLKTAK